MSVEVLPALLDDLPTIANLMSLYLFEYSATQKREIGADGAYRYASLEGYWSEPGCHPFLIRVDGQLAGFALVAERRVFEPDEDGHVVAEFFILPIFRRRGVGALAATTLFERFAGQWWVGQAMWNTAAQGFWRTVIRRYTGGVFQEETWSWEDEAGIAQIFASAASV